MARISRVLVVCFALVVLGGLLAVAVDRVRHTAAIMQCRNNLKQIGLSLHSYHDSRGHFPAGTLPAKGLEPDRRLSWWVEVWPAYIEGTPGTLFDRTRAWDDAVNDPPRMRDVPNKTDPWDGRTTEVGEVRHFRCPLGPEISVPGRPCLTQYVGVAGVGEDAAALPLGDRRAGFFGHDRKASAADIEDGTSMTFAAVEAMDGGPWTAGGRATVRPVVRPYLGAGGP
ncbi:MAG: DUF1559 domain-containing protein, partial [Gemmataceae bacterium]